MKALVVFNQAHKLLPQQEELLNANFPRGWQILPVPEEGWDFERQCELAAELCEHPLVFASPVPFLLARVAAIKAARAQRDLFLTIKVDLWVFHNDSRVAREVPDGKGAVKVIHTVAPHGWILAKV